MGVRSPGFSGNTRFCFVLLPKAGFVASYREITSQMSFYNDFIMNTYTYLLFFTRNSMVTFIWTHDSTSDKFKRCFAYGSENCKNQGKVLPGVKMDVINEFLVEKEYVFCIES